MMIFYKFFSIFYTFCAFFYITINLVQIIGSDRHIRDLSGNLRTVRDGDADMRLIPKIGNLKCFSLIEKFTQKSYFYQTSARFDSRK